MNNEVMAKIYALESFGAVDGPGVRFIVFLQGCPLKCLYCHNPDSWKIEDYTKLMSSKQIVDQILSQKQFYSNGGVTFSGGEPLMQSDFLLEIIPMLHKEGFHTCVDTSGFLFSENNTKFVDLFLNHIDLTLLDIKAFDEAKYEKITGGKLDPTLKLLNFLEKNNKEVWIRYVLVPNLTDDIAEIERLADYLKEFKSVKRLDVLPFHKMGEEKWTACNQEYTLKDTPPCSNEMVTKVKNIFIDRGIDTH